MNGNLVRAGWIPDVEEFMLWLEIQSQHAFYIRRSGVSDIRWRFHNFRGGNLCLNTVVKTQVSRCLKKYLPCNLGA